MAKRVATLQEELHMLKQQTGSETATSSSSLSSSTTLTSPVSSNVSETTSATGIEVDSTSHVADNAEASLSTGPPRARSSALNSNADAHANEVSSPTESSAPVHNAIAGEQVESSTGTPTEMEVELQQWVGYANGLEEQLTLIKGELGSFACARCGESFPRALAERLFPSAMDESVEHEKDDEAASAEGSTHQMDESSE
mmetsp:Transcript_23065/g.57760  ORF Transcript_23065/g.57760 Transcript_23065/m.57760 type:complete len:199 (-) Transcript_23065:995-1591(-)